MSSPPAELQSPPIENFLATVLHRTPLKPTKVTLLTMILYNSENSIRDIGPFWRPLFYQSGVLKYTSSLLHSSELKMRLDCQILLKSPPPQTYWLDPPLAGTVFPKPARDKPTNVLIKHSDKSEGITVI